MLLNNGKPDPQNVCIPHPHEQSIRHLYVCKQVSISPLEHKPLVVPPLGGQLAVPLGLQVGFFVKSIQVYRRVLLQTPGVLALQQYNVMLADAGGVG